MLEKDQEPIQGSCLCGEIRFEIDRPVPVFRYCHCPRCRKATGSAHASNIFVPFGHFKWTEGEERIGRFDLPESTHFSSWFCRKCGSPVPHPVRNGDKVLVPAGSLDNDPQIRPQYGIWWSFRAPWYVGCDQIPEHELAHPHQPSVHAQP